MKKWSVCIVCMLLSLFARYICLKLDAEKEKEHGFFRNYRAAAFPSFFWLDEQGKLLDMQTGYADAGKFIRMASEAFFPDPVLSNASYKHLGLPVFHREYLK